MALFDKFKNKKHENNQTGDANQAEISKAEPEANAEENNISITSPLPQDNNAPEEVEQEEPEALVVESVEVEEQLPGETEEFPGEKSKKGIFERFKLGLSKTRQNIGGKIDTLIKSTRKLDEDFYEELEEILIQADVGMDTSLALVDKIRTMVKKQKINDPLQVTGLLQDAIAEVMGSEQVPLNISTDKPTIILVVGVNGAGKTTTIAKLAYKFKQEKKKVILAAGDTFRAAAIDQLQIWADRTGVELIKHQEGSDPGAVVFDAISAARARKADVLIIDTAGRLQNKTNLMKEISKIRKVIEKEMPSAPHEVLLVLDATTGQNAISQARIFSEATGVSGIVLTKLDGTAKGGIVIAVARELGIPVKLVGIGEGMEDLREFSPDVFARALFAGE
jgi:fused signal recognition particle receptor